MENTRLRSLLRRSDASRVVRGPFLRELTLFMLWSFREDTRLPLNPYREHLLLTVQYYT